MSRQPLPENIKPEELILLIFPDFQTFASALDIATENNVMCKIKLGSFRDILPREALLIKKSDKALFVHLTPQEEELATEKQVNRILKILKKLGNKKA
ncbi:MAG: hypothetical protein Q7R73_02745 [bacterium]|nr:hypothetical protein [bacterium]